jgi:DNA-binding CsgD family transcriptional regulator
MPFCNMDTESFSALVDRFYAAALEPDRWPEAAARTAGFFASESTTIQVRQGDFSNIVLRASTPNYDETSHRAYAGYFHKLDPFANGWRAIGNSGIYAGHELVDPEAFRRSEIYNDYCSRLGIFHTLGAGVDLGSGTSLIVGIHRPIERDDFAASDRHLLEVLLPHLSRAAQVHNVLGTADLRRHLGDWMLKTLSVSAIAVDRQCRVVFANDAAQELLQASEGLRIKQGRLTTYDPRQAEALWQAVCRPAVIAGAGAMPPGDVLLVRRAKGQPLSVLVAPLQRDNCAYSSVDAWAIIFAHNPASQRFPATEALAKLYRLSPAQARLLEALLQGERIGEYANRLGISTNTANTQLKQIFAKTGTNRQSDLMRQISSDPIASLAR